MTSVSTPTSAGTPARSVTVEIEELVLVGFDRASAAALSAEIRKALVVALTEHGPPASWTGYLGQPRHDGSAPSIAHMEVSIRATDSLAAIAETLASRLCAGAALGDGSEQP